MQAVLALEPQIIAWAEDFARKENALFLGRGLHYPIALEGALKLKEISYIHAEAYPAGELKHGPLALVTPTMPVVTVAPNDALLEKLKSNMQEVRARGGELYVFADADTRIESSTGMHVIRMPEHYGALSPDPARGAAAVAGVSHGVRARDRCGQAAESGEERDGGVGGLRADVSAGRQAEHVVTMWSGSEARLRSTRQRACCAPLFSTQCSLSVPPLRSRACARRRQLPHALVARHAGEQSLPHAQVLEQQTKRRPEEGRMLGLQHEIVVGIRREFVGDSGAPGACGQRDLEELAKIGAPASMVVVRVDDRPAVFRAARFETSDARRDRQRRRQELFASGKSQALIMSMIRSAAAPEARSLAREALALRDAIGSENERGPKNLRA